MERGKGVKRTITTAVFQQSLYSIKKINIGYPGEHCRLAQFSVNTCKYSAIDTVVQKAYNLKRSHRRTGAVTKIISTVPRVLVAPPHIPNIRSVR